MDNKAKNPIIGFSKKKILQSGKYQEHRDVLTAILDDGRKYSHKQVQDMLNNYYKKGVK